MTQVTVDDAVLAQVKQARQALTGETYTDAEIAEAALDLAGLMWANEGARKTETERHEKFVEEYKRGKAGQQIVRPTQPEPDPEPDDR